MKRSGSVALGLVGALAMALTACDSEPDQRCVDTQTYKTVADKLCRSQPGGGYADTDRYQWYAKGGSSTSHVGGYHRSTGGSDSSKSHSGGDSVSRGGFGGHGSGHSGGS
ncbi:hypothetical protein [Streptacidiphilus monticola]|uniref:Lipoprotein n=1 Tax=Streptacidiphilus monticola TaxID=2161674 RepID=A0ABW1G785_9ACTN